MKKLHSSLAFIAVAGLITMSRCRAAEQEKTVAFRTVADTPNRYVTVAAGGAINTSSLEIADRQIFVLVDLNGGELADGDTIQIKYAPVGARATYWREGEGVVNRTDARPDAACTFKIKLPEKTEKPDKDKADADKAAPLSIMLQTASSKFVSVYSNGGALATTDNQGKAVVLEVVENPVAPPK
jgi:hypothetical protein